MATPPNNFFATNIFNVPDQESTPVGAPNVIVLDFDTLGITEYSLSCTQFTSYLTYVFLTGATTGVTNKIYLPSTNSLSGQTVMIKNTTADDYSVQPSSGGVQIDAGTIGSINIRPLGTVGDIGAVTVVANPTPIDSWYITDVYVQL